ncbi:TonB-dependent receptor plug domain-containing protein [Dokdonella koreensis]|uniref:TonB-dependent receptor n=1 Tax=Dokdonella koreensis DS-123 TaxID=1300342 RepID=A0A160DXI5_9GAMM|nr:TonB-dependent receptor [Dokdonella koreensis]ANB19244.1 TonB-dependent receptor [Dokdonella koreensis DS-123]
MKRQLLAVSLSQAIALALPMQAAAQTAATPQDAQTAPVELDGVVVTGQIVYRDRADAVAPTLSYDLAYFQRFEPRTVGDMLKRVPSVAFLSDVLEYDGARLRGMDPGYTQILINGKKVPGAGDDRSFFVDRIPAEVVERIEIVRSPSANRSGDAMAGAINIVLRDAYEFDGAYIRAGASVFDDGEVTPTLAGVASGDFAGGHALVGISHQGRYNPKQKQSLRYEAPGGAFVDREDQSDTRDGTDDSFNLSYTRELGPGRLSLSGLYVKTDRTETEHSREFNVRTGSTPDHLLSVNDQVVDIDQENLALSLGYAIDAGGGRTEVEASYARFKDTQFDTEEEIAYDAEETPPVFDGYEGTRTLGDMRDSERALTVSHKRDLGGATLAFGVDYTGKDRDARLRTSEVEAEDEGAPLPPYVDFETAASTIEERRVDPYLMFSGSRGLIDWETGLRYETTDVDVTADGAAWSNDYATLLPSAHLRWNLGDDDRISLSLARTVRRPAFRDLLPLLLEEEYGDNDFIGDPQLDPERAWGLDLGFEHRLGRRGIVGVNLFYRDVQDLIEIVSTGQPSATALDDHAEDIEDFLADHPGATPETPGYPQLDPDSWVYTAANVGDGHVYGVELDLSTPLTALGLPDTGVFLNYSWLDSSVKDALGKRRFNDQARSVFNVGFIHDIPSAGLTFGASYRRQGDAYARLLAEEVTTEYGADLEAFVEKRFGKKWTVRLTGSNLLDASKDETFHAFDTLGDQIDRDYDEYERETEKAGPVFQLVARYVF